MRINQRKRMLVTALFVIAVFPKPVDGAEKIRVVALSGRTAPGIPDGAMFAEFEDTSNILPVINNAGQVAFRGQVVGSGVDITNNTGIWSEGGGNGLALIARLGSPAPGVAGDAYFSSFLGVPVLNAAGQIALRAQLNGNDSRGPNDSGLWLGGEGAGLHLIARHGDPAPGLEAGVNFKAFSAPLLNAAGHVAFQAIVAGNGITHPYHDGIWSEGHGSGLELVTQFTAQVPGMPLGTQFDGFHPQTFNSLGELAFEASFIGEGIGPDNDSGIWRTDADLGLISEAQESEQAPELPSGVLWRVVQNPVLNNTGDIAFNAWLTGDRVTDGNNRAVYVGNRADGFSLIARSGEPAPGTPPGTNFGLFSDVAVNDAGQVAFYGRAGQDVSSTSYEGIWSEGIGSGLSLVARAGDQVPGAPPGVVFDSFGANPVINDLGHTAFLGILTGPGVTFHNDVGIYIQDRSGQLHAIARNGDQIDVDESAAEDWRTISDVVVDLSFGFSAAGDVGGLPSSLNDRGELVFKATFTDGSAGVFVSRLVAIPEPKSCELLLLSMAWFASTSYGLGRHHRKNHLS